MVSRTFNNISYSKKRERDIPLFLKGIIDDTEALAKLFEDVQTIRNTYSEGDVDMTEYGIIELIVKNFELLDTKSTKELTTDFHRLFKNSKVEISDTLKDLVVSKLKEDDRNVITYTKLLRIYDIFNFIVNREANAIGSYKTKTDPNSKSIPNMLRFLWVKIEERFTKTSHAFRYFDEKSRTKISFNQFAHAIENLKIKFHRDDMKELFNYLDADKDGFLNYAEFARLNANQRSPMRASGSPYSSERHSTRMNTQFSRHRAKSDARRSNLDFDSKLPQNNEF